MALQYAKRFIVVEAKQLNVKIGKIVNKNKLMMSTQITVDSCRVCLDNNGTVSLFTTQNGDMIADMIAKCSSVQVRSS